MRHASDVYTYYASFHRRPLVNGYSGVLPYSYRYIEAALVCYPCAPALAVLADLDVRTHVFHLERLAPAIREEVRARIAAAPGLAVERAFGETLLLRYTPPPRPGPPADLHAVPRDGWRATSSRGPVGVERALDADAATAWSTAPALDALGSPRAGTRLLRGLRSWDAFFALVPLDMQWFAIDLGAARRLRRAVVVMSAWAGFLPGPAPTLEGSLDGTTWTALGGMPAVEPSLFAFAQDGPAATFVYTLPATPWRHVRLRYPGFWTLFDVALDE